MTRIESADLEDVDAVVECWVDLAAEQREHASHLLAAVNRGTVREAVGRHVLTEGLLVARTGGVEGDRADEHDGSRADDAEREDGDGEDGVPEADVVGFVMFGPQSDGYDRDVARGFVRNVYVRPAYRGRGIGSALLNAAERRMAEAGLDVVALEVMADNEAARRLYRRRGYEPHRLELEKGLESDTHTN